MARYTDIDLFLPRNDLTGDVSFRTDISAVGQSIANLALTRKGERPFSPNIGTDLVETLQVYRPEVELVVLKEIIVSQLETQEPRAKINNIQIERIDENYKVTISFTLLSTGALGTTEITV